MMVINRRPAERGRMLLPAGPRHRPGEVLLCADDCLGLFLAIVLIFCYLISVGLPLLRMWWPRQWRPSSCRSSSLPERGSWIAGKVPSPHGTIGWWLSCVRLGWHTQNVMPCASMPRLSNGASLPGRAPLVLSVNSSIILAGCWTNAKSSFAYIGNGPGGAGGNTGGGASAQPASLQWMGSRANALPRRAIITVGCGHFQRPSRLGMLPVQDILQFLKSAQEVLTAVGLLLECLQETWASSADLWD
jgi:hypothetical protein